MSERIVWRTAQPLWQRLGTATAAPAVLRFAGDDFMDTFGDAVACGGAGLAPLVAGAETWRDPGAGLGTPHESPVTHPIRLFQPTHGRFYLVTGSLVCRRYGHPDRAVDASADESVSYVLRRLEPAGDGPVDVTNTSTFVEHGWSTAVGTGAWLPAPTGRLAAAEDRLPVFPVGARCGDRIRKLHAGLLPVSRREALESHPPRPAPGDLDGTDDPLAAVADPRLAELQALVIELQHLRAAASAPPPLDVLRESLYFAMVDLAGWLARHLPAALAGDHSALGLNRSYGTVNGQHRTWGAALRMARDLGDIPFDDGPPALVAISRVALRQRVARLLFNRAHTHAADDAAAPTATDPFVGAAAALPSAPATPPQDSAGTHPQLPPPATTTAGAVYVARFVYVRPHCRPAEWLVLSEPTRPFRFAPFHDPDAPGRPVRIPLPVDTSPGGLRRFPKNVSVVLSSELRKQMAQVSEKTLREGDTDSAPDLKFGMLCQLSIPIITICALILLMIIVSILNIVFWWIPLFKICLPLPKRGGS